MPDFIDHLEISAAEKDKLRQLGADTPASLLSLIEAAPGAFETFLGHASGHIRDTLLDMVPNAFQLQAIEKKSFPLGSILSAPPVIKPLPFNIGLRDQLFNEWQTLQRDPSTRNSPRTQELQAELSALLER